MQIPRRPVASLEGVGTITADLHTPNVKAPLSGAGELDATLQVRRSFSCDLVGEAGFSAFLGVPRTPTGTLSGAGTISAPLQVTKELEASLAGSGGVSGAMDDGIYLSAGLEGGGTITAPLHGPAIAAHLTAAGTTQASLGLTRFLMAGLSAGGDLQGTLGILQTLASQLEGEGSLSVQTLGLVKELQAALAGAGDMQVLLSLVRQLDADLAGAGDLLRSNLTTWVGMFGTGSLTAGLQVEKLLKANRTGQGTLTASLTVGS